MNQIAQELMEQRDRIKTGKWVQRNPIQPGEACLVMYWSPKTNRREMLSERVRHFLERRVRKLFGPDSPAAWNDSWRRTKEEVVDFLNKAILETKTLEN